MERDNPPESSPDFPPPVLDLFDKYVHGIIDRRSFLKEAGRFAVGTMTAVGLLDALNPRFAAAQKVPEDDARLQIGRIEIGSPKGYGKAKTKEDFLAAARFAKGLKDGNGRLGAVGFCYGGGMANFLATRMPDLEAAVPFYGSAPALEDVPRIKAALLLHFAGKDERVNAGWPAYEKALKAAGIKYEAHIYPGVQHGFNNDTTPRHDEAAAKLAWTRTLDLFNARLRG